MTRTINATAPIRICDLGGWTDTWFAGHGTVLNIAVSPGVHCQITVRQAGRGQGRLTLDVENFGDRYTIDPRNVAYDRHPLLEAAIDAMATPPDLDLEVNLFSEVPPGCSTGTSAAATVALIGALDLVTAGRMTPGEVAAKAHEVETVYLGLQCGTQDQLAAAHGGICYIEMSEYPGATVTSLDLPEEILWELEARLSLIYLGHSHRSSAVHEKVIAELEGSGPSDPRLEALRQPPEDGRTALLQGDFAAFGEAMTANTGAQMNLHPALVSEIARRVIEIAHRHGALGWKVNGAGGEGGSITLLSDASRSGQRKMIRQIIACDPVLRTIPIAFCRHGLRRWISLGR